MIIKQRIEKELSQKNQKDRMIKISYSVLKQFLSIIIDNDSVANWNTDSWEWSIEKIPQHLKDKAQNILENS